MLHKYTIKVTDMCEYYVYELYIRTYVHIQLQPYVSLQVPFVEAQWTGAL